MKIKTRHEIELHRAVQQQCYSKVLQIHTVPTQFSHPGECEQVDIKNMSKEDLSILRETDPFMYYSIPGVRRAKMHMQDIDASNLGGSSIDGPWPKRSKATVARRSRRISVEADPVYVMDEEEFRLLDDYELGLTDGHVPYRKSKKCRTADDEYDPLALYLMSEEFTLSTDEVPSRKNRTVNEEDHTYRSWF